MYSLKRIALVFAIICTLVFVSRPANAQLSETCAELASLAGSVMKYRQYVGDFSEIMGIVGDNEVAKAIVFEAFQVPRFSSPQVRDETVKNFSSAIAIECYKASHKTKKKGSV